MFILGGNVVVPFSSVYNPEVGPKHQREREEKLHFSASVEMYSCVFTVSQVLHLHLILGLQDLLRVWLHDAGPGDSVHCYCVCDHRVHILPP